MKQSKWQMFLVVIRVGTCQIGWVEIPSHPLFLCLKDKYCPSEYLQAFLYYILVNTHCVQVFSTCHSWCSQYQVTTFVFPLYSDFQAGIATERLTKRLESRTRIKPRVFLLLSLLLVTSLAGVTYPADSNFSRAAFHLPLWF